MEATFIHDATRVSLDPLYSSSSGWVEAENDDPFFLNNYARDNPKREDMAVSFVANLAVCYRPDRFSKSFLNKVKRVIPYRIAYFDD